MALSANGDFKYCYIVIHLQTGPEIDLFFSLIILNITLYHYYSYDVRFLIL